MNPLDDEQLSALIRSHASRHVAPESLRAGLRTQAALADAARRPARAWRWAFSWPNATLGFALGLLCAVLVLPLWQRLGNDASLEAELVASHVRALQIGPLIEVASSDRHTVKPWFQGRLDYAPPVPDLAEDGFPLAGGRIDHVRGSAVAALAYHRRQHVIDVFVWPATSSLPPQAAVQRGFSVLHWSDGAMQVWAVTDAERAELERFAAAWRSKLR